jgi:Predicted permeases
MLDGDPGGTMVGLSVPTWDPQTALLIAVILARRWCCTWGMGWSNGWWGHRWSGSSAAGAGMWSELLGVTATDPTLLVLFVGFGLVVGVLFGFFGMGGSFLVTPALLMLGYPARVAVGSGMAFVFGTAVIATLKHSDLGQVDYRLGVLMIAGTTVGIELGRASVLYLESMGLAAGIISVVYVVLLGAIGVLVTRDARTDGGSPLAADGGCRRRRRGSTRI